MYARDDCCTHATSDYSCRGCLIEISDDTNVEDVPSIGIIITAGFTTFLPSHSPNPKRHGGARSERQKWMVNGTNSAGIQIYPHATHVTKQKSSPLTARLSMLNDSFSSIVVLTVCSVSQKSAIHLPLKRLHSTWCRRWKRNLCKSVPRRWEDHMVCMKAER